MLRNRATNQPYLVIVFTLYLKEDVNEDGSLKPAALEATRDDRRMAKESGKVPADSGDVDVSKDEEYKEAKKHFEKLGVTEGAKDQDTGGDDDVD